MVDSSDKFGAVKSWREGLALTCILFQWAPVLSTRMVLVVMVEGVQGDSRDERK